MPQKRFENTHGDVVWNLGAAIQHRNAMSDLASQQPLTSYAGMAASSELRDSQTTTPRKAFSKNHQLNEKCSPTHQS
jgi:hypothetical protein